MFSMVANFLRRGLKFQSRDLFPVNKSKKSSFMIWKGVNTVIIFPFFDAVSMQYPYFPNCGSYRNPKDYSPPPPTKCIFYTVHFIIYRYIFFENIKINVSETFCVNFNRHFFLAILKAMLIWRVLSLISILF